MSTAAIAAVAAFTLLLACPGFASESTGAACCGGASGLERHGSVQWVTDAQRAELRAKAQERIARDRHIYSESQVREIERQYESAFYSPLIPKPTANALLSQLVEAYPLSNRAGCSLVVLATLVRSTERESLLRRAISNHEDAWFEDGVQVGALARGQLAIYYAGLGRLDEAEVFADEVRTLYPGAIDHAGARLDEALQAIKLLRHPAVRNK